MKHIFLINNHIIYLMSRKIIDYHKIAKKDVLFLTVRHYVFPSDSDLKDMSVSSYEYFSNFHFDSRKWIIKSFLHRNQIINKINQADAAVNSIIKYEDFILYAPHIYSLSVEILLTMPNCRVINYVEEGTQGYMATLQNDIVRKTIGRVIKLWIKRWLTGRRYGYPFQSNYFDIYLPKFCNIYCCCNESFPGYPQKIIIGFPFQKYNSIPDKIKAVIVFDGGIVTYEQQTKSNEIAIQHFIRRHPHGVIHYKFHPRQKGEICDRYREHFSKMGKKYNIIILELPRQIVLEQLIATLRDQLDLYIICSSVGLYGIMGGAKVFTTANRFIKDNTLLQMHYQTYGSIFLRYQEI